MNEFEKLMLEKQAEREQKAKNWFANKPNIILKNKTQDIIEENRKRREIVADEDRKRQRRVYLREFRNTVEFMTAYFPELDALLPFSKGGISIQEYEDKKEEILMNYKNKCNFIRSNDHDYLWKCLTRKFKVNYWQVKRDYKKITEE